jgi:hypothetical protein
MILIDSIINGPDLLNKSYLIQVNNEGICYWGYNHLKIDSGFDSLFINLKTNNNTALVLTKIK